MFNTITYNGNNAHSISFNSTSGTLVKSTEKSKFIRFAMESVLAARFFDKNKPHRSSCNEDEITVLQVMLC